jgi:predicted RNA-binding Zn-ribbon protein involved in translation (DUF1610 family)
LRYYAQPLMPTEGRLLTVLGARQQGARFFCPLCQNDGRPHRTPDFSVENGFRCHKCGWHGDGFKLVAEVRHCDFRGSVSYVATVYGLSPPTVSAKKSRGRLHPDADRAARAALWSVNSRTGVEYRETGRWPYHAADDKLVAYVLRFDPIDAPAPGEPAPAKTYLPIHLDGQGWRVGDPGGLWPLYRLPDLLATAGSVLVCEGEKSADAGRSIGLLCTTSAHGAKSPQKSDWTPLAGREVIIMPDNDQAGLEYANDVAALVTGLNPPATARILKVPNLPEKGDLADFCDARDAHDPEILRAEIESLAASAPAYVISSSSGSTPQAADGPSGDTPAYYDAARKEYLVLNSEGTWLSYNENQYKRILRGRGLRASMPNNSNVSAIDLAILEVQDTRSLVYSGQLAGWPAGVHTPSAGRILVTRGPRVLAAIPGEWPHLRRFLETLLADNPLQLPTLLGWLQIALTALRSSVFRPGQAVAIAGPRNCGKSLLQKLLTELLGGRFARPHSFMAGKTEFNKDLFEAEHLMVEDDVPSTRIEDRRNFGARIKEIAVNEGHRLHAKHRDALLLPVLWRLTISVNDEPENLMILPPMDESLVDKIILLRARQAALPCETETDDGRARCWQILTSELPAFLDYLQKWSIPQELRSNRFGVKHFHHPDILQTLEELAPESKLSQLIDMDLFPASDAVAWMGTASELERRLSLSPLIGPEARRLLSFNNACAAYLGRLASRHPARYRKQHTRNGNCWTIHPPEALPAPSV